jgi:hypothetical protein
MRRPSSRYVKAFFVGALVLAGVITLICWMWPPRGLGGKLSGVDEHWLRLQLKSLMVLQNARDLKYEPSAPGNRATMNVFVPGLPVCGMAPSAVHDPAVRANYLKAIAENERRREKFNRELELSRRVDAAVIGIWRFVSTLPGESKARAYQVIEEEVADKDLMARLKSEEPP